MMAAPMGMNINWGSITKALRGLDGLNGAVAGIPRGQIGAPPQGMPWGGGGGGGGGAPGPLAGAPPWPMGGAQGGLPGGVPWPGAGAGGMPWNPQAMQGNQPVPWNPAQPFPQGLPAPLNQQPPANRGVPIDATDTMNYTCVVFTPDERMMGGIFDSGAGWSLISETTLQKFYGGYNLPRRKLPRPIPLGGMGGYASNCYDYVTLPIKLKAEQDFGFVELRGNVLVCVENKIRLPDVILGMQFLRDNKLMLHWGEGHRDDWIEWNGLKLPRIDPEKIGVTRYQNGARVNMAMDMRQLQQYLDQIARMSGGGGQGGPPGYGQYGGRPPNIGWPPGGGPGGGQPQGMPWPLGGGLGGGMGGGRPPNIGFPPGGAPGGMGGGMPWGPQAAGGNQPPPMGPPPQVGNWGPEPAGFDVDGVPAIDVDSKPFSTMIWTPNDEPLTVVMDTGAGITLISEERLQRSWPGLPRSRLPGPYDLRGFGGHDQYCNEGVDLTLKLKAEGNYGFIECKTFAVIMPKRSCVEVLLGLQFIRENKLTMHWGNSASEDWLEWGGLRIPRIPGQPI